MNAPFKVRTPSGGSWRARDAWTAFWQEPGQSRCLSGAADVWQVLTDHWTSFAVSLAPGVRVLDLGCGAGAVGRVLSSARHDVHITGIDFARIPLAIHERFELLSDTAMESVPFAEASFGAVVSQFGYEYSQTDRTAREMARILAPNARFSLLIHHAGSSIVAADRDRLNALDAFLTQRTRAAFCSGNAAAFNAWVSALARTHPHDTLVAELARSLPLRLGRAQRERIAIWNAVEEALAPERCLSEALQACCVAREDLDNWLRPLREVCGSVSTSVLREPNRDPIAWKIEGALV